MAFAPLTIAGVGLLLLLVSVPLWLEKIPPNRFYGFRTPRTVADDRVWYPANRAMGRDMSLAGLVMVLCAAGMLLTSPAALPLILASALAPFLAVVHGFYRASALVAELDGIAPPTATSQADPGAAEAERLRRARQAAQKQRER